MCFYTSVSDSLPITNAGLFCSHNDNIATSNTNISHSSSREADGGLDTFSWCGKLQWSAVICHEAIICCFAELTVHTYITVTHVNPSPPLDNI